MPPQRKINVILTAVDRTKAAFTSIKAGLSDLGSTASKIRDIFAGFLTLGTGASLAGIKRFTNEVDQLAKTADKLGVSTEELSKLRFAAELTGVSANTLDTALQRLTRRIAEAAQGAGPAKDAIAELGLSAQELVNLTVDEQFKQIADAFQGVRNNSDRVRIAFKLVDSEAVGLLNTFEGGRAQIEAFGQELENLGGVISEDTAAAAEAFNDNVSRLQKNIDALTQNIGNELIPNWNRWLDLITGNQSLLRMDTDSSIGIRRIDEINEKLVALKARRDELTSGRISLFDALFGAGLGDRLNELDETNTAIEKLKQERADLIDSEAEKRARVRGLQAEYEHNQAIVAAKKAGTESIKAALKEQLKEYDVYLNGLKKALDQAGDTVEGFNELARQISQAGADNPFERFQPKDAQGRVIESWAQKTIDSVSPVIAIYDRLSAAQGQLSRGDFEGALTTSAEALQAITESLDTGAWVNPQSILDIGAAFQAIITEAEEGVKVQITDKEGDINRVKNKIKDADKDAKIEVDIDAPPVKIEADEASISATRAAVVAGLSEPITIPIQLDIAGLPTELPAGTRGSGTPGEAEVIIESQSDKRGHRI